MAENGTEREPKTRGKRVSFNYDEELYAQMEAIARLMRVDVEVYAKDALTARVEADAERIASILNDGSATSSGTSRRGRGASSTTTGS